MSEKRTEKVSIHKDNIEENPFKQIKSAEPLEIE